MTKHEVGDRVGVGCFVDSCGECDACGPARSSTASTGSTGTYNATAATASRRRAATRRTSSSTEHFVLSHPGRLWTWTPRRRCCARASPCTRRSALGSRTGQAGRDHRHGRSRARRREDRARDGRRGHRAQPVPEQEGRRPAFRCRSLPRHQRPGDFKAAARKVRPDRQHRLGESRHRRVHVDARDQRNAGRTRVCRRSRSRCARSASRPTVAAWPARWSAASRETQEMLDFCAEHGIGAEIEVISADRDQRRLRPRGRQRRAVPIRDRHGNDLTYASPS